LTKFCLKGPGRRAWLAERTKCSLHWGQKERTTCPLQRDEYELKYYWSIIFFDIEEPIFLLENENIKLVIDINSSLKIDFVEKMN
jgi:hypothetical protein